jgi:hypothetical protein
MRIARPLRIAGALAAIVLIALGGVFAFLLSLDLDRYKPLLAAQVKAATGRDLEIQGRLAPRFGLTPALAIEGVSLSNAAWGEKRPMLTVERFEAQLQLVPLLASLGRRIVVERIVLSGAELWLETDDTGSANWRFRQGADPIPGPGAPPTAVGEHMPDVVVLDLEFRRVRIGLKLGATAPRSLALEKLALRGEGAGGPYWFDGNGRLDAMPFEIGGRIAALGQGGIGFDLAARSTGRVGVKMGGELRRPFTGRDYDLAFEVAMPEIGRLGEVAAEAGFGRLHAPPLGPLSAAIEVSDKGPERRVGIDSIRVRLGDPAGLRATIEGALRDPLGPLQKPPQPPGLDLRIAAVAPDVGEVARRLGLSPTRRGALGLDAVLRDDGAPRIAMPSLKLSGPGMDLNGSGLVSFEEDRPSFRLRLSGGAIDLGWVEAESAGRSAAAPARADPRLIPDIPIPYDALGSVDIDVGVELGTLALPQARLRELSIGVIGREGRIEIAPVRFAMDGGSFEASTILSAADRTIAQRLSVDGLDLGTAFASRRMNDFLRGGRTRLRADLRGEGERLREVAGTLAGSVDLDIGGAVLGQGIRQDIADWLAGIAPPLAQIQLGLSLRCAAYSLRFAGGIGTLARGVFDTGPALLRTAGTIDLGSETLALRSQLGPLGFRTTGNLSAPQHRLDAAGTARGVAEGAVEAARDLLGGLHREQGRDPGACRGEDPGIAPGVAPDVAAPPLGLPGALRDLLRR